MQLVVVTGLSGAGKTVALNCLEDLGYYCIDNMPPALMGDFLSLLKNTTQKISKAAICIDARAGELYSEFDKELEKLTDTECRILFLEASDVTLIRRFNETRRTHPLSPGNVRNGIALEKELLARAREMADNIIDTSNLKSSNLNEIIREILSEDSDDNTFIVNVSSFGYKNGMPMEADLVFDMRFIPNPFYVPELKALTGNDKPVQEYVLGSEPAQNFLAKMVPLLEEMIPAYEHEGKYHINIACGCTGGHHRSVAMANELSGILKEKGYRVTLVHRDI